MNKLSAITAALDLLLLSGIFLLFGPSVKSLAQEKASQRKLRSLAQAAAGFRRPDRPSLSDILALAVGLKGSHAEALFVGLSTVLALAAGLLLFAAYGPGTGLLGFLCAGLAPYLLVRTRLQNKQVDVSREGEQLLTELLNNYRICRFNMREAVERTALSIEEAPLSKKLLLSLSRELNAASGTAEVRKAIDRFRLAISTSWGDLLAADLEFAEIDGIVVTESLKDLVSGIADARRKLEQNRRETSDSAAVLKYLFPATCLMIWVGAVFCFGMTTRQLLHNQFATRTGFAWFLGLALSYLLSLMISAFVARQKMDI